MRSLENCNIRPSKDPILLPSSTLGPSGPNDAPEPSESAAATVLRGICEYDNCPTSRVEAFASA